MKVAMCTAVAAFVLCAIPALARADVSSLVWGDVVMLDGGTYAVQLNTPASTYVTGPETMPGEFVFGLLGNLYRITDSGRELVQTLHEHARFDDPDDPDDGDPLFAWSAAGSYELDLFGLPPPVVSFEDHLRSFLAHVLFADVAHAQFGDPIFLGTIRFTIEEAGSCAADCFSNVLFLPGFEGSILKLDSNTLWPPTLFDVDGDLEKLKLNEDGTPANPGVVTSGVVSTFYGVPVYRDFIEFANGLVANGTIADWKALPYDWRYSPEAIIQDGVATVEGIVDVVAALETLAASSKSGKVTIVSHSNGGLVGKALVKKLEEEGKDDLVDAFVMVGAPQLGTPQAVGGLLHGEGSDIAWHFFTFVSKAQARSLGRNLASAHNLLPSREYFAQVIDPPVVFDTLSSLTESWRGQWGIALNSYAELFEFLAGLGPDRSRPPEGDTLLPEVLRTDLLTGADELHQGLDAYAIPSHIRVVQIVGWGLDTIKGINYTERHGELSYEAITTVEGDGTVVYPSAGNLGGESYYFDLDEYAKEHPKMDHLDLLSSGPVQTIVHAIVTQGSVPLNEHILSIKPTPAKITDKLLVSTHSPVLLGVYNEFGNFTGIDPNQDPTSGVLFITEDIPNSGFLVFGENQYVFLPKEGIYTLVFEGTGEGTTTVEIGEVVNDVTTLTSSYTDIPTTPQTVITFVLQSDAPEQALIEVDVNGDGDTDVLFASDGADPPIAALLTLLKEKITNSDISKKLKKNLLKKIAKLEKKIKKGKAKTSKILTDVEKKIVKKHAKGKITDADAQELLILLAQLESAI